MVGGGHHVRIVFHNDDRVSQIPQLFQNSYQPCRVATVQANGWLVENVSGAHESRAETGCELDPLRLAPGQRRRKTIERQILQPNVIQKLEAFGGIRPGCGSAISDSSGLSCNASKNSHASAMFMLATCAILQSPNLTSNASGRNRAPRQSGHSVRLDIGS